MSKLSITRAIRMAAIALAAVSTASFAQGRLELNNAAFQEVEVENVSGEMELVRQPVSKVVPGTEVIYVVTYRNVGDEAASNVVVTNPIPSVMEYVGMSASGRNTNASFSADGGGNYLAFNQLTVTDAEGRSRPASAADITNVRFQLRSPVQPGSTGTVEYRARLK